MPKTYLVGGCIILSTLKKILAIIVAAFLLLFFGKLLGLAVMIVFKLAIAVVIIGLILMLAAWLYDKFLK